MACRTRCKTLLLRAYKNWDFPKGMVEPGEEPLDAALREVREETTLGRSGIRLGHEFHANRAPITRARYSRYYLARSKDTEVQPAHQPGTRHARAPRSALGDV